MQKFSGCASVLLCAIIAVFAGLFYIFMSDSAVDGENMLSSSTIIDNAGPQSDSLATGASSEIVDRVDDTLLSSERENWQADPESKGWSESDRDFLAEHGVSEAEARAAETILREQGIE